MTAVDYIALDWGTSNLRAWAMTADGQILAHKKSDRGMSKLEGSEFEPVLLSLVSDWLQSAVGDLPIRILACGMLGARQGWIEAPYAPTPCHLTFVDRQSSLTLIRAPAKDQRIEVYIASGVKQTEPADVMRGEETQVAGYLSDNPDFRGVICLPGTHCKWVSVADQKIEHFQTAMTGEVFALLREHSLFRHSPEQWDQDAFLKAVSTGYNQPEAILARLFTIRADFLLSGCTQTMSRLSGLLVGCELAAARHYWHKTTTVLIGNERLTQSYCTAIESLGGACSVTDGDTMTIKGLFKARQSLEQTGTAQL